MSGRRACARARLATMATLVALVTLAAGRPLAAQTSIAVSPFTPLGFFGIGVERVTAPRRSVRTDLTGSLWRSIGATPAQFALLTHEWRYHRRAPGEGPYLALDVGVHGFRVRKWDHRGTDRFQEGFGAHGGGSVGYEHPLGGRWTLDLFAGGGTMQSLYKGYEASTGSRYDGARGWNRSGELVPYRMGVMLSHGLRRGSQ